MCTRLATLLVGLALVATACGGETVDTPVDEPTSTTAPITPTTAVIPTTTLAPFEAGSLQFDRQLMPTEPFDMPYGIDVDEAGNVERH